MNQLLRGTTLSRLYAVCLPPRDSNDVGGGFVPSYNPMFQFRSGRYLPRDVALYQSTLTMTHELFHSTNPKAGNTDDFWLREGWTTYYGFLIMARLGYITPQQFFNEMIQKYNGTGYKQHSMLGKKSLRDVSFQLGPQSYLFGYDGGALTAFALDTEIRIRTSSTKCLDDVVRQLFHSSRLVNKEYTYEQLLAIVQDVSGGQDFRRWFDKYVSGTTALALDELLARFGISVTSDGKLTFADTGEAKLLRDSLLRR
jgi:predicted metalloprotease with PDZ domain